MSQILWHTVSLCTVPPISMVLTSVITSLYILDTLHPYRLKTNVVFVNSLSRPLRTHNDGCVPSPFHDIRESDHTCLVPLISRHGSIAAFMTGIGDYSIL